MRSMTKAWVLAIALTATPALAQTAQPDAEAERAGQSASEHHGAGPSKEAHDPSKHFNFVGQTPGKLFDYKGKDVYGGTMGDGKMVDPHTGEVTRHEEPASPPFIFAALNFALLLALLAWKGRPAAQKAAADRHDQIKTALDEAAELRKQAAAKLAEYDARLKKADAEIKQLVEGMRADARNEEQRILAAAEAQAAMMKRDAELRIAAEIELARVQLTREVTAASVAATEKLLREKMTGGDQQQLIGAFISDVQKAAAVGPAPAAPTGKGAR